MRIVIWVLTGLFLVGGILAVATFLWVQAPPSNVGSGANASAAPPPAEAADGCRAHLLTPAARERWAALPSGTAQACINSAIASGLNYEAACRRCAE